MSGAPDANGWMPIETAPTDGSLCLLFNLATGPAIGWREPGQTIWTINGWGKAKGYWHPGPTHWQPLPGVPE